MTTPLKILFRAENYGTLSDFLLSSKSYFYGKWQFDTGYLVNINHKIYKILRDGRLTAPFFYVILSIQLIKSKDDLLYPNSGRSIFRILHKMYDERQ